MGLREQLEPVLESIRTEAWERYERYLAEIPDKDRHPEVYANDRQEYGDAVEELLGRFRSFYVLDTHDFAVNVGQLSTPMEGKQRPMVSQPSPGTAFASILSADVNFMRDVVEMIHTEQWNSPAATDFRDDFLKPFERAADWHGAYVKELALAAQVFRETVDQVTAGLRFVAEGCLSALRYHQLYEPPEHGGDWRGALGGFSIFAAAVGLFLPASPAAFAVGGISLLSAIASLPPAEKEPYLVVQNSPFPHAILRGAGFAIRELEEMVLDVDETLARGLNQDLDSPNAFASPYLRLPPPGVDADTYATLDIRDGDGKPPNQVVVSVVALGRAGYVNLPGAAYEYSLALSQVEACAVPSGLSTFFPRSIWVFNTAGAQLAGVLRRTRDDLLSTGEVMLTAARTYQATDEEQAQILGELNQLTPHHSRAPYH